MIKVEPVSMVAALKLSLAIAFAGGCLAAFVSGSVTAQQATSSGAYTLVPVTYGMQLKTPDGRVVFEYLTKKPEDVGSDLAQRRVLSPGQHAVRRACQLLAPTITRTIAGMYLAWHDAEFRQPIDPPRTPTSPAFGWSITKADFWGWGEYAPRDGRVIENKSRPDRRPRTRVARRSKSTTTGMWAQPQDARRDDPGDRHRT